jgi:prepilin-type N-terminal cleavage/methylation domain-containing protein
MTRPPSNFVSLRRGFSLLEIIIATAVLAGSAMVLVSMIGVGSRYGQQAERRTLALAAASSLIDELMATYTPNRDTQETTGVYGVNDPLGYRIRITDYAPQTENQLEPISGLLQITVEMFSSEIRVTDAEQKPLCALTRIMRVPSKRNSAEANAPSTPPTSSLPE